MLDNMSPQKRLLLATVISMFFMLGYSFLVLPNTQSKQNMGDLDKSLSENEIKKENLAPKTSSSNLSSSNIVGSNPISKESSTNINGGSFSSNSVITKISSEHFAIEIDSLGRIKSYLLKDKKFKEEDKFLEIIGPNLPRPLEVRFEDKDINSEAFNTPYTSNIQEAILQNNLRVVLQQKLTNTTVTKEIIFYENGSYDLSVKNSKDAKFFISPGYEPKVNGYQMTVEGALIRTEDETKQIIEDGDTQETRYFEKVNIASSFDRYYVTMFYSKNSDLNIISSPINEIPILFAKSQTELKLSGYIGAKEYNILKGIDESLIEAIEYGYFTIVAKPIFFILNIFHSYIGNWGWAIICITILIRIILYPLTYKGMVSMQKLKDIAPQMKEIQKKYKEDSAKMQAKMMELYKKHGANPMGGCLPLLLQIPVFFAIYRVLLNSVELQGAEWMLWVDNLALKDPYYILPILMGISMFLQQKLTPSNFQDPMQEKIFKFLPIIFTFFFLTFPAGLTLYWFVNNVLSILQQLLVNKQLEKIKNRQGLKDGSNNRSQDT